MPDAPSTPPARRGVLGSLLALFSSIPLGIVLLILLFIYCSIGSAGLMVPRGAGIMEPAAWYQLPVRQLRGLELTEFEWFHWWPFKLLIALLCVNVVVATLRRIPLRPVNYGVWMIHTGIITLAVGSVWYFTTKIEGDAPIVRRAVEITLPSGETGGLLALPGKTTSVGDHRFSISEITPDWEILTGEDQGKRAYSVSVLVEHGTDRFVRQLLAGYPEYTEDVLPGQGRAVNAIGRPLVDESLRLDLALVPQDHFYVMGSWALYVREPGATAWVERPVGAGPWSVKDMGRAVASLVSGADPPLDRLPRYVDRIPSGDAVWSRPGELVAPDPIDVEVPSRAADDPLADTTLVIDGYLRYAIEEASRRPGGDRLDPWVAVRFTAEDGRAERFELVAADPMRSRAAQGELQFHWVGSPEEREAMLDTSPPIVVFRVPELEVEVEAPVRETMASNPDLPFTPIEGTPYAYRIAQIQDQLSIGPGDTLSVAIVEIRNGETTFQRFVCDDPSRNRDFPVSATTESMHEDQRTLDAGIETVYRPGRRLPMLSIVAGPGDDELGVIVGVGADDPVYRAVRPGEIVPLRDGVSFAIAEYAARSFDERLPRVVPPAQRDRDGQFMMSWVRVRVPGGGDEGVWLPFQLYPFDSAESALHRFRNRPVTLRLADGRDVEMVFSRRRHPLPAPVVLDDFVLTEHIGGYTGATPSIRDWTSWVRFHEDGAWTEPAAVSVNKPIGHEGFWFFQAQWDPPEGGAAGMRNGLTYTVLGVGNRHGVNLQLIGCAISVIGMIYAFYIKPVIKRRRQQAAYAGATQRPTVSAAAEEVG